MKIKPEERIEMPEALIRYFQRKEYGIPYVDGGLLDQPFLWVQEDGVISNFLKEWEQVHKNSNPTSRGGDDSWLRDGKNPLEGNTRLT